MGIESQKPDKRLRSIEQGDELISGQFRRLLNELKVHIYEGSELGTFGQSGGKVRSRPPPKK